MTSITPKFLFEMSLKQVYYDESKISDDKIQIYYDLLLHEGNRQATLDRFSQKSPDRFQELQNLNIPTLIIWGKHDAWIPVSHAYQFEQILPDRKLIIYDNAGHVPMEEIPYQTVKDVSIFLNQ
jgi:pimeloyl-ACP methyl ester carboxylesterase